MEASDEMLPVVAGETCDTNETTQPEGLRMNHLREALDKTVQKCLSAIRLSAFKENFRPLYDHNAQALKSIHEQMIQQLKANISDEISKMFEQEKIISLMNGLDDLKLYPEKGWRPTGDPDIDLMSHVLPIQVKHCEQLSAIVKELESRNRMLQETVQSRQEKLYTAKERVEKLCAVWQKVEGTIPDETAKTFEDFVKTCDS